MPEITEESVRALMNKFAEAEKRPAETTPPPKEEAKPAPEPVKEPRRVALPEVRMSLAEIKEKYDRKCPKCGKFTELVIAADNDHSPGVYCTEECGWMSPLPGLPIRCGDFARALSQSVVNMVNMAPANPQVRAQLHASIGKNVPRTCTSAFELMEWVNAICVLRSGDPGRLPVPTAADIGFDIGVEASFYENGTCSYSRRNVGTGSIPLDSTTLREIVADSIALQHSWSGLLESVKLKVKELTMANPPRFIQESPTYEDFDSEGDSIVAVRFSADTLSNRLARWMSNNMPAELTEIQDR